MEILLHIAPPINPPPTVYLHHPCVSSSFISPLLICPALPLCHRHIVFVFLR